MKLSKEQIQFIDTYLQNSGVEYVDIRWEMLDHIASGVEERMETENADFCESFKCYMVIHKKEILKNNKRRWSFSWEAIRQFLMFLTKPYMLVIGVLILLFYQKVDISLYFQKDFKVRKLFFLINLAVVVFQFLYFNFYLKKRFYILEKSSLTMMLIYYGTISFFPTIHNEKISVYTLTFFSFLIFGYTIFFFKEMRKFNTHRYNFN